MSAKLLERTRKIKASTFGEAARRKGLSTKLILALSDAAEELYGDEAPGVLGDRARFEEVALQAVIGDAGNLELSFKLVDSLANAVEKLGLARSGDEPDAFRRVWIQNESGQKIRGVVLRRLEGEIAIFCPPAKREFADSSSLVQVSYRAQASPVSYQLQLNDAVRLPQAYVLHLTRPAGQGAIGRMHKRYILNVAGFVHQGTASEKQSEPIPCRLMDISYGGVCLKCSTEFERGSPVYLEAFLEDGSTKPFGIECIASWMKSTPEGNLVGLQFGDLDDVNRSRLEAVLVGLQDD